VASDEFSKEVRNLNSKAFLLLFVIFFALGVTTYAISLNTPKLNRPSISEKIILNTGCDPAGDPVDGGGVPH